MSESFDYVIVGAGSAGCVLAMRLAEAGHSVCVLEAGPMDRSPYIHVPGGFIQNLYKPAVTWGFTSDVMPGTADRRIPLPQGRVVGGSSSINGMIFNRGQPADYDSWASLGIEGWSYQHVLPYFKRAENRLGPGDPAFRGSSGPLAVSDLDTSSPICQLFLQAAKQCGIATVEDYNGPGQDGAGPCQFTIGPRGPLMVRMSTARAFLRPALKTGKVTLRVDSPATQVLFDQRRATGVRYRAGGFGGPEREVRARREVVLSAGALNTPRLLQLSGIGPAEHLRSLGVPVVVDAAGVGENLADHFQLRVAARLRNIATLNERSRGLPLAWEGVKWLIGKPSLLGMGPVLMKLFARGSPGLPRPDIELSFTPASLLEGHPGRLEREPGMTAGGYQQRPESRGFVRAVSRDIAVPPKIQPNYLTTETDRTAIVAVVRTARRLLRAPAVSAYYVDETFPGANVETDDEILDFSLKHGSTAFHHTGTARMGQERDPMAVVNSHAQVIGVTGLRVADASIIPLPTSGNTNAPTIMLAEKVADLMVAGRG